MNTQSNIETGASVAPLCDAVFQELLAAWREFCTLYNSRQMVALLDPPGFGYADPLFEEHAVLASRMLCDLGFEGPKDYDAYLYAHDGTNFGDPADTAGVKAPKTKAEYQGLNSRIVDLLGAIATDSAKLGALGRLTHDDDDWERGERVVYILRQICKYAPLGGSRNRKGLV